MKKNRIYIIIILIELFILIGLITYFIFINPETKYEFDPAYREDKEFSWVLSNLHKKVDTVDYYYDKSNIINDYVEISKNTALEYKDSETMLYSLFISDDVLGLSLSLANNHNIDVVFISSNSKAYKYHVRSNGDDDTKLIKYKELPRGQYRIFINDNDIKYDTMEYIVIE